MGLDNEFLHGADRLKQRIRTIRSNYDVHVIVPELGQLLLNRTRARFDRQVDPDNNPWKALLPSTLRRKDNGGYGDQPALVRERSLRDSIQITEGGEGSFAVNTGAQVRIGIQDEEIAQYARLLQKGTKRMSARAFLGIGALDIKAVDGYMRRRIVKTEAEA